MAKGKPDLTELLSENEPTDSEREFAEAPTQEYRTPDVSDEVKKQVPLRLPPSVVRRITVLAGRKTIASGRRVSNQDLLEAAVMNYLKREEAALRREAKKSGE